MSKRTKRLFSAMTVALASAHKVLTREEIVRAYEVMQVMWGPDWEEGQLCGNVRVGKCPACNTESTSLVRSQACWVCYKCVGQTAAMDNDPTKFWEWGEAKTVDCIQAAMRIATASQPGAPASQQNDIKPEVRLDYEEMLSELRHIHTVERSMVEQVEVDERSISLLPPTLLPSYRLSMLLPHPESYGYLPTLNELARMHNELHQYRHPHLICEDIDDLWVKNHIKPSLQFGRDDRYLAINEDLIRWYGPFSKLADGIIFYGTFNAKRQFRAWRRTLMKVDPTFVR